MDKKYTREVTDRFLSASDEIMKERDLNQSDFAKSVALNSSNFSRLNAVENNVTLESVCEMINKYNISPIWLLTGKGEKRINIDKTNATNVLQSNIPELQKIIDDMQKALKILKKDMNK